MNNPANFKILMTKNMKSKKWKAVFINVKWKPKGTLQLKEISYQSFGSKEAAMGYAYNIKGCAYVKEMKKENATIVWNGNPSYGYTNYPHVVIIPDNFNGFSVSDKDRNLRTRLQEMFFDWFKDNNRLYIDTSIQMGRLAWITTIPKGWKLLPVGSMIKKTDKEFGDSPGPNYWGIVSWYNVGKKVSRTSGIAWVKKVNGKDKVYKIEKGHNDPLIIRKITNG